MDEIIRWPSSSLQVDHNTAKVTDSQYYYPSWSGPPLYTNRIVNCVIAPAQARWVLAISMMVVKRLGTAMFNPCFFSFQIFDGQTGSMLKQVPTSNSIVVTQNASTPFPVLTWNTVFQSTGSLKPPRISPAQYLAIVYTGSTGTKQIGINDVDIHPIIEVALSS